MLLLCFLTNKRCHLLAMDLLLFMYSIFLIDPYSSLSFIWGGDGINSSFLYLLSLDQVLLCSPSRQGCGLGDSGPFSAFLFAVSAAGLPPLEAASLTASRNICVFFFFFCTSKTFPWSSK